MAPENTIVVPSPFMCDCDESDRAAAAAAAAAEAAKREALRRRWRGDDRFMRVCSFSFGVCVCVCVLCVPRARAEGSRQRIAGNGRRMGGGRASGRPGWKREPCEKAGWP